MFLDPEKSRSAFFKFPFYLFLLFLELNFLHIEIKYNLRQIFDVNRDSNYTHDIVFELMYLHLQQSFPENYFN